MLHCYNDPNDENDDILTLKKILKSRFASVKDDRDKPFGYGEIENIQRLLKGTKIVICVLTEEFINNEKHVDQLSFCNTLKKLIYYIKLENFSINSNDQLFYLLSNHKTYNAYKKRPCSRRLANVWTGSDFDQFLRSIDLQLKSIR